MDRSYYICIPITLIPQFIINAYKLYGLVHGGYIYIGMKWGIYGLPQEKKLQTTSSLNSLIHVVNNQQIIHPSCGDTAGAQSCSLSPVQNFSVNYVGYQLADRLVTTIKKYGCSEDYMGGLYCGITLNFEYGQCTMDLSIPR